MDEFQYEKFLAKNDVLLAIKQKYPFLKLKSGIKNWSPKHSKFNSSMVNPLEEFLGKIPVTSFKMDNVEVFFVKYLFLCVFLIGICC